MSPDGLSRDAVRASVDEVRERIERAGGHDVTLVAVTKGFGPEAVEAVAAAGVGDVGENVVSELLAKRDASPALRRHFLGRIQRRDVRRADGVDLWQTVDRPEAGVEIARRWPGSAVLVQVNLSGAANRPGCGFDDAPALVQALGALDLDVRGLMGVAPVGPPEKARPGFARLVATARATGLDVISMGMTDDLEVAVQEGATMVRIGRALFGPRPVAPAARR